MSFFGDPARHEHVYHHFYRIPRMGAVGLTGHGGPFGFDIAAAVAADYLVTGYGCDGLIETGCFLGDTTAYLAAAYPDLPVTSCDIAAAHVELVRRRLRAAPNVTIEHGDAARVVAARARKYERPFFYLDAHGGERWPLQAELEAIERGIVCIDDFDVGHPRFAFDTWNGVVCGPELIAPLASRAPHYWVLDPEADLPFPCLQMGRRGGKAWLVLGLDPAVIDACPWFLRRDNGKTP